jgi:hypothetical protein
VPRSTIVCGGWLLVVGPFWSTVIVPSPARRIPLVVRGGRFGILETHHEDRDESLPLGDELGKGVLFDDLAGSSAALRAVLSHVAKVAPTNSTVLVTGETGMGKELIARAIHKASRRSAHPIISVNCAAIPASLIATEGFGHERVAFALCIADRDASSSPREERSFSTKSGSSRRRPQLRCCGFCRSASSSGSAEPRRFVRTCVSLRPPIGISRRRSQRALYVATSTIG